MEETTLCLSRLISLCRVLANTQKCFMLVKNLLMIWHWNNSLNGISIKGHKTCVCIRTLPALLNHLYFYPLLNLHSYPCNFLEAEQASVHVYWPIILCATYSLKEHKMGTELKKDNSEENTGPSEGSMRMCMRKMTKEIVIPKYFWTTANQPTWICRSFNIPRCFPGLHEVHIFLFSSKNENIFPFSMWM